jgi:hypothetical protein
MAEEIQQGERKGLSRRQMIKASAVAGAAAWTAPVIIGSLSSPAAAASIPCGTTLTCSWIYVLYRVSGTYYVSGFNLNGSACGGGGSNTHGAMCNGGGGEACEIGGVTSGVSFSISLFNGGPLAQYFSYNTSNSCGGAQLTPTYLTQATTPSCTTYLSVSGGSIVAIGGAEIVSAIGFGGNGGDANHMHAICPQTSGTNNQLCAPATGC